MARAEVFDGRGNRIVFFDRPTEDRAWRTVQTQATTEHTLDTGVTESRFRWPVGTTVLMDGQPFKRLTKIDGQLVWEDWDGLQVRPPIPPSPGGPESDY